MPDETTITTEDLLRDDVRRLRKAIVHFLRACPESCHGEDPDRSDTRRYGEAMLEQSRATEARIRKQLG